MKIAIATGTYPPEIGGSSDYSSHLFEALREQKQEVCIATYGKLKRFPTGVRHILFFLKLVVIAFRADYIIALDAFSVGLPTMLFAKLFRKKIVIRLGGDFLWESFVERTQELIPLSQFYTKPRLYILKDRVVFMVTRFVLRRVDMLVFSTKWQREIMRKPYGLKDSKTYIIENFYAKPVESSNASDFSEKKIFFSPSRDLLLKNKPMLRKAFEMVQARHPEIILDEKVVTHSEMLEKIKQSYAVVVPSISEVSPNLALHAIQFNVPVVLTEEMGLGDRLKDLAVFIKPLSVQSIENGLEEILKPDVYQSYKQKIFTNTFSHSWNEIASDFLALYKTLI